jgi:signal transduction histidine kinase
VFSILMAATGALIVSRHPRHLIGWLLLALGLGNALASDLAQGYGVRAVAEGWPAGTVGEAIYTASVFPQGPALVLIALLFPTNRLPGRRWWLVVAVGAVGAVVATVGFVLSPQAGPTYVTGTNPYAVSTLPTTAIYLAGFAVMAVVMVAAFVATGLRFRRSTGIERQQLKLFALSTGALLVLPIAGPFYDASPVVAVVVAVAVVLWPISIGIAILRYRLYDIDVVINKALVFGTLAFFITVVYVAIVVGVGRLLGGGDRPNLALSVAATAVVAVAFQPVRDRVQRFANRLVYGERATPYEVLSDFADRVGGSYDAAELLPRMARTVAEGVGAARVEVWLATGGRLVREAAWPDASSGPSSVSGVGDLTGDRVVEVRHQGEPLGALSVVKPVGETLTPGEERLLDDVAAQAGLVLRNVALIEELRSSRQRLVTTQDEERRRLERNLHDGAQQTLVSVGLMIQTVRAQLGPEALVLGPALDQAADQLRSAIAELRELARGIHPVVLTERGLEAALGSLAERSPVPVVVDYGLETRLPGVVEAGLYFVVAEALTNVAKYAHATQATVRVTRVGSAVRVQVADDGIGGADPSRGSGLRGLVDRVAVIDGTLEVTSPLGRGTTLTCTVPLPAAAAAEPAGGTPEKSVALETAR